MSEPLLPRNSGTAEPDASVHTHAASGLAVTTRLERQTASGRWLLASAPSRSQAAAEWEEHGAAWLLPGVLFAAAVIGADVIHAALGLHSPEDCATPLADLLDGPLFFTADDFDGRGSYTALLPARAAQLRPMPGAVAHPQHDLLLVPAPDITERVEGCPWWASPLDGPGLLCSPDGIAALVAFGRGVLSRSKVGRNV
jgi:hypothetical protein